MANKLSGVCALTGHTGPFVKCHILPEALTRHEVPGQPIFQTGERGRPIKRMTSWYDPGLVTADGEKILADYDNWAIRFLRSERLVWSGWQGRLLRVSGQIEMGDGWFARTFEGGDWPRLRLFLLSLLWRAAASRLPEFSEITLTGSELDQLRGMILSGNAEPLDVFPASLVQLSTKGPRHNHTPLSGTKPLIAIGPMLPQRVRIFRFFLEGIIIHFDRDSRLLGLDHLTNPILVCGAEKLVVLARPFEGSFQEENLGRVLSETWADWPQMRPQLLRALWPGRTLRED